MMPQVTDTSAIKIGNWIRLFAAKPTADAAQRITKRRLRKEGLGGTVSATSLEAGGSAAADVTLPLTPAMEEGMHQAQTLGLDQIENEDNGGDLVHAYQADGTLDAYLYYNNAVDSGLSECRARGGQPLPLAQPLPVLPLL